MKTFASPSVRKVAAIVAAVVLCGMANASDKPAVKSSEPVVPKSVFVNIPESGKDPFFPNSTRRLHTLARVVSTTNAPQTSAVWGQLVLKGISGTKAQPLALINSSTIAEGEVADIKWGLRQVVKVRCLEIRDSSVLVQLVGTSETRELKFREGI